VSWSFARIFYGQSDGLDLGAFRDFLARGYVFIPMTLQAGRYRAVVRTGDHDAIYAKVAKPFPDILIAQKPEARFALHLSGGFDSAILAALYDRPDADYIHFIGPESPKARALAATLKGRLHELSITAGQFIEAAEHIASRVPEPYAYEDIVYAYLASAKAKELGHDLVVTGDGGDGIFGGARTGPYSRKAFVIWKSIDPNNLLGLRTLQPYMHSGLYAWAKSMLPEGERGFDKSFAARFCAELGLPGAIVSQRKGYWAGSIGMRQDAQVQRHLNQIVDASPYRVLRELRLPRHTAPDLPFRLFGLVRWLERNHAAQLDDASAARLRADIDRYNRTPRDTGGFQSRLRQFVPPALYPLGGSVKRALRRRGRAG
jgi:hypothetical protein